MISIFSLVSSSLAIDSEPATIDKPARFQCFLEVGRKNKFRNIWRLFDVLPNFPFTTSGTIDDYYL